MLTSAFSAISAIISMILNVLDGVWVESMGTRLNKASLLMMTAMTRTLAKTAVRMKESLAITVVRVRMRMRGLWLVLMMIKRMVLRVRMIS
jgi:hypothetical protein